MPSGGLFTSRFIKLLSAVHEAGSVPCETYPELWFPEDFPDPESRQQATKTAKKLCGMCKIKTECFEYALETNQQFGIWGGTSPDERI